MTKDLLIVFVKNKKAGKVKTRLAKTIGNQAALEIYESFLEITEKTIKPLDIDKEVYFSEAIENNSWSGFKKHIQQGNDLGERMHNAFINGFESGYKHIVLIGTDLPDIKASHIKEAFNLLKNTDSVLGPAEDGGYYLIGLSKLTPCMFENKPWSQPNLFKQTTKELKEKRINFSTLETLNDVDTFEDLIASKFYQSNKKIQEKLKQFHDKIN